MNGIKLKGNAYKVFEELQMIVEYNKGLTLAEYVKEQNYIKLRRTVDKQVNEIIKEVYGD